MLSYLRVFLATLGAALVLFSTLISRAASSIALLDEDTVQIMGFALFMVALILQTLVTQMEINKRKASQPRLVLDRVFTEPKTVYQGQTKIGDFLFALIDIANIPRDWDVGQSAEKATAEITLWGDNENQDKNTVRYGRWWDRDIPLFPTGRPRVREWKQTDIDPGHPETLVLAHRPKRSKIIYAFYYTDHKDIKKLKKSRRVGRPPVNAIIRVRGKFIPKKFELVIDIGDDGDFVIEEKKRGFLGRLNRKRRA